MFIRPLSPSGQEETYPERMDTIMLAAAVLLLVLVGIVVVLLVMPSIRRSRTPEDHDDQLRAGADSAADIGTATDRATGTTAWMRPGGGGV